MSKVARLVAATAVIGGVAMASGAGAVQAGAQLPELTVYFSIGAAGADAILDALEVEVYTDEPTPVLVADPGCVEGAPTATLTDANRTDTCDNLGVAEDDYVLGLNGLPAGLTYTVDCISDEGPALVEQSVLEPSDDVYPFFSTFYGPAECYVYISATIVAVDKVVDGGPTTLPEFPVDLVQDGSTLASGADPAPNVACAADLADCALINVQPDFSVQEPVSLVETPPAGYELAGIECDYFIGSLTETLDGSGVADVDGDGSDLGFDGDIYCEVTNTWIGGTVDVDASVTNDNGGMAAVTDVSVEVYDSTDTLILGPTACAADGSCLTAELPPGDYTIGYAGPAGYSREITQTVTNPVLTAEQAIVTDDPDAAFTIVTGGLVEIDIAIDDPVPATTTTTSTTTTTTTTTIALLAPTIPATGTSGTANAQIAAVALGCVVAGGLLVIATTRRR